MSEDYIKNRIVLFLISLLTAGAFWFYVLNSEPLVIEKRVPVVFLSPPGMAPLTTLPTELNVKIKGSRTFVKSLTFEKEKVFVDLKKYNFNKDTFIVDFDSSMIPLPFGITVLDILPAQVMVSLEKEIKKKVPVIPEYVGEINPNLKLVKKDISPAEFMISGPISVMRKTGAIRTLPLDLTSLDGDQGTIKLSMAPVNPLVKIAERSDITLSYTLRPNKANMTLKNIPIRFLTSRSSFSSRVKNVALDVLISDEEKFETINNSAIKVIAELPNRRGNSQVKLKAELPEGIHLLQIHPESINVSIK